MYLDIFARVLLILGGLNYLFTTITQTNESLIFRVLSLSVGLAAIYFLFDRDFYLPFLGKCVIPVGTQRETKDLKQVLLNNLPPNTHIIYWAAKSGSPEIAPNPMDAYADYSNSGIVKTNENGQATINIACPIAYNVHYKRLRKHLHYRYELPEYRGMFSKVYTKFLENECA
jgi:hypothetical protein